MVPIIFNCRYAESGMYGPDVSPAQFRRLDSTACHRLVMWDLSGFDTMTQHTCMLPAIIPSEDIRPNFGQRERLVSGIGLKTANLMPNISGLLSTGLLAPEYSLQEGGPLNSGDWGRVWTLLNAFATVDGSVEHPLGFRRQPVQYRHDLRSLHQRLAGEHRTAALQSTELTDNGAGAGLE